LVAALQSSQLAGMDGYHWVDEDQSRRDVQQHLQELSATYSLDPKRLVVGGFSNGGRTALLLALTGAIQARQVIVISVGGSLRDETFAALDWNVLGKANQPHLLLIAGDQDTQVLPRLTQQVEGFKAGGLHVDLQIVPNLGHLMPPDFAARLTRALAGLK
jgi:predicted esterase